VGRDAEVTEKGCTVPDMFVVMLKYVADLAAIDAVLPEHGTWLEQQYADGIFLASGRQVPRVGGVILAAGTSRTELERRLMLDPFRQHGLAEYTVVEFTPSRVTAGLEQLQA
jgi:uncharacterized protein YciI